jgi:hypothetical protein
MQPTDATIFITGAAATSIAEYPQLGRRGSTPT